MASTKTEQSELERNREDLLTTLARLGGRQVQEEEVTYEGTRLVLPEQFRGRLDEAAEFLEDLHEQLEQETSFDRVFRYRPWDGAYALEQVIKEVTGTGGLAKPIRSFFGTIPPAKKTIDVGPSKTAQVPWGQIEVPLFKGTLYTEGVNDPELGPLFKLTIVAPKKFAASIEGFFLAIEEYLRSHSIYRGQAIDGKEMPSFIDTRTVDPSQIVYSNELRADLNALVWRFIRERESLAVEGIPFKRAVVLFGKYGTGKTETANLTAKYCVENNVTFIKVRAGKDDLGLAMQTARLLQPAVVFFEDVDTVAEANGDQQQISRLLDMFDGMDAKQNDVMVILTTNHITRIHKGMMRPGRIDAAIEIGLLDADGIRQLAETRLGVKQVKGVDWDKVAEACTAYTPAFVNEALKRVFLYHEGTGAYTTEELVHAATGLRSQYTLMEEAVDTVEHDRFERLLGELVDGSVREVVNSTELLDYDEDVRLTARAVERSQVS